MPTDAAWIDINLVPAPVITGAVLGSNTIPTIVTGTGTYTDTIRLYDNGNPAVVGTAIVKPDGTWSIAVVLPSYVQQHLLTATQTDNQLPHVGLTGPPTPQGYKATTLAVIPATPTITSVTPSFPGPVTNPAFKNVGLNQSTPITLSGTGTQGDTITIYDGGQSIGTVFIGPGGTWTATVAVSSQSGSEGQEYGQAPTTIHTLTVTQSASSSGGNSPSSAPSAAVTVTLWSLPLAPYITTGTFGQSSSTTMNTIVGVPTTIAGSALLPNATVKLYDNGVLIATLTANGVGYWSTTTSYAATGTHAITATETDPTTGFVSNPSATTQLVVYVQPPKPTVTSAVAGNNPGLYTVSGTGVVGDTISLFDGSSLVGSATVQNGNSWSIQNVAFRGGSNSLTATQTQVPGVTSVASVPLVITVTVPAQPTVGSAVPVSNSPGQYTVSGTGLSGDTITLYDGTTVVGTGSVQNNAWSIQKVALVAGANSLTATQSAAPGITSASSAALVVNVTPPAPPAVTGALQGQGVGVYTVERHRGRRMTPSRSTTAGSRLGRRPCRTAPGRSRASRSSREVIR